MITVALLSKWHVHAAGYAKEALNNPRIVIKAVWDEDQKRGMAWANELGVEFEPDLGKVLENPSIDAVIVDTPTSMHKDVIIKAAKNGKHIFTEKVLAFTEGDCLEIFEAIEAANVQFMISLPRLSEPYYLYTQSAINNGALGKLTTVRCRVAHNGAVPTESHPNGWLPSYFYDPELCGGGAMIDLGAHPIYLSNRLGGSAIAVTARLCRFFDSAVDINSVAVVEYASGAVGILETGFVSGAGHFLLEVHGTEGSIMVDGEELRIKSSRLDNKDWFMPNDLPPKLPSAMEQWVGAIEDGIPGDINKEDALRLTQINQAAALSHQSKRRIELIY